MTVAFLESEVKQLLMQLLAGVQCLHDNWILHRMYSYLEAWVAVRLFVGLFVSLFICLSMLLSVSQWGGGRISFHDRSYFEQQ